MKVFTHWTESQPDVDGRKLLNLWIERWRAAGCEPAVLREVRLPGVADCIAVEFGVFPNPAFDPKPLPGFLRQLDYGLAGWQLAPLVRFSAGRMPGQTPLWKHVAHLLDHGEPRLMVVLPFCNRDAALCLRNVQWLAELGPYPEHEAVISYPTGVRSDMVKRIRATATACFKKVHATAYATPARSFVQTAAFFHAARKMAEHFCSPWLWLEADMVALSRGWLINLEAAYWQARKPFLGVVVPGRGHVNGTAVYPSNTPTLLAKTFAQPERVWDCAAKEEMLPLTADRPDLIQHVWGVHEGKLHPFHGEPPSFKDGNLLSQILPSALLFHRTKDGSLIEQLRKTLTK